MSKMHYPKKHQDREVDVIHHEINRIFEDHLAPLYHPEHKAIEPNIEIVETKQQIDIMAELAGVKPENITLNVDDDRYLSLKAEKEHTYSQETQEGYYFSELSYGSFQRLIRLPDSIDTEKITADIENGVLHIHLPKKETNASVVKKIPVSEKKKS